jgi:hypothetical protein
MVCCSLRVTALKLTPGKISATYGVHAMAEPRRYENYCWVNRLRLQNKALFWYM